MARYFVILEYNGRSTTERVEANTYKTDGRVLTFYDQRGVKLVSYKEWTKVTLDR